MFEVEEMGPGFHDIFNNKFSGSSGMCFDLFTSDSMQDMLDIDIKQEVATVVGGVNEFTALVNDLPNFNLDSNDGAFSWLSQNSNDYNGNASLEPETQTAKWPSDIYSEVGACVNPNSVMPVISTPSNITVYRQPYNSSILLTSPKVNLNTNINQQNCPSPKEKKSHLTFSPNTIKVPVIHQELQKPQTLLQRSQLNLHHQNEKTVDSVRKDLNCDLVNIKEDQRVPSSSPLGQISNSGTNTIKLAAGIGGLTFANSMAFNKLKSAQQSTKVYSIKRDSSPSTHTGLVAGISAASINSPKTFSRNVVTSVKPHSIITTNNKVRQKALASPEYPKPAYSYSCLIAMALKNSRSGSLPVSEIYSFMCEHFPYFKTAPNGWKNSVRHNLSLNKCFEKIEKPPTNGGQRKGCLWAMNPHKVTKMDEEVQKWSRKDPMGIRKAMVFPENLEALERGEMKHGSTDSDDGGEIENNASDIEENSDLEDLDETGQSQGQMYTIVETSALGSEDEDEDEFLDEADQAALNDLEYEISDTIDEITIDEENKSEIQFDLQKRSLFQMHQVMSNTSRDSNGSPVAKRPRVDVNYQMQFTSVASNMQSPHQIQFHQHLSSSTPTSKQQGSNNRRKVALVNRNA